MNKRAIYIPAIAVAVVAGILKFSLPDPGDSPRQKAVESAPFGHPGAEGKARLLPVANLIAKRPQPVSDQIAISLSEHLAAKLRDDTGRKEITAQLSKAAGATLIYVRQTLPDVHVFKVERLMQGTERTLQGDEARRRLMDEVVAKLGRVPGVGQVTEDILMFPVMVPNDPRYGEEWHLQTGTAGAINATEAWDKSTGAGVVVAVVDTGITDHPDLNGNVLPGYDFVNEAARAGDGDGWDNDPHDRGDFITAEEAADPASPFNGCPVTASSWHGSHVAGIIAAQGNNNEGVSGVAPGAKILPVRVLGKCGGYATDIAAGIYWASGAKTFDMVPQNPNPAKIINMSLGGYGSCPFFYSAAISLAKKAGSTVVVAAGNSNTDAANFAPANCPGVITVGAVGKTGNRSWYSNYGSKVAVAAPGGDSSRDGGSLILSTVNSGETVPSSPGYAFYQGTSMATPVVSGAIALTMAARPGMASADAANVVISKAVAFPSDSNCLSGGCGKGIINALASVGYAAALGSDLAIDTIRLADDALIPTVPASYVVKVLNKGNSTAAGDLTIKTYLSASNTLDDSATLLSEVTKAIKIPAASNLQLGMNNIVIPADTPNGTYYLHVLLVASEALMEKADSAADNTKATAAVPVATPQVVITKKVSATQAPSLVAYSMTVQPPQLTRRVMKSDFAKAWAFSDSTPTRTSLTPVVNFSAAGTHSATATVNHPSGFSLSVTDSFENTEATPFSASIAGKASNKLMREPLAMSYAMSLTGGHPLDRVAQIAWSIDDGPPTIKSYMTFQGIPAGQHKIKAVMTSRYGATATAEDTITVIPNQAPTCNLTGTNNVAYKQAIFTVSCTDPDGRIKSYEWSINGTKTAGWSATYKTGYTGTGSMLASVKVTDDGGAIVTKEYTLNY